MCLLHCTWHCCYSRQSSRWSISHIILAVLTSVYLLTVHSATPTQAHTDRLSDCIDGITFLNTDTGCCEPCDSCNRHGDMYTKTLCNVTHDSKCGCESPLFLSSSGLTCYTDCRKCPGIGQCHRGTQKCICPESECYELHDIYCRNPIPCQPTPSTEPPTTVTQTRTVTISHSLPPWGFGLIAIGIVIGIIVFASCFLCMGLSTLSGRRSVSQEGSENSENGLVVGGSIISGTNSSYLSSGPMYPYLSSHSMLELLKNTNSQLILTQNGGLTSIQNSPGVKKFSSHGQNEGTSSLQSSPLSVRAIPKSPIGSSRNLKSGHISNKTQIV